MKNNISLIMYMNYLNQLLEKPYMAQLLLTIVFIIYLIMGYRLPTSLAYSLSSTTGKISVIIIALVIFAYSNPILGVVTLIVAYQLITSSSKQTGMSSLAEYYPTETRKWSPFTPTHQFPYTLEQEIVKKMTNQKYNTTYKKAPYRPVLDNLHNAANVNYNGPI